MNRVCLVNGSLRGKEASSLRFLNRIERNMDRCDFLIDRVTVKGGARSGYRRELLETMAGADALVIAFPLFCYTLPGALTALLEDFHDFVRESGSRTRKAKVYAVVNCGFPEPWIMEDSVRVIRNFCTRLGLSYRFSILIGTGPAASVTMRLPFFNPKLKRAFALVARDIERAAAAPVDVQVKPIIPKAILLGIKAHVENTSKRMQPAEPAQPD